MRNDDEPFEAIGWAAAKAAKSAVKNATSVTADIPTPDRNNIQKQSSSLSSNGGPLGGAFRNRNACADTIITKQATMTPAGWTVAPKAAKNAAAWVSSTTPDSNNNNVQNQSAPPAAINGGPLGGVFRNTIKEASNVAPEAKPNNGSTAKVENPTTTNNNEREPSPTRKVKPLASANVPFRSIFHRTHSANANSTIDTSKETLIAVPTKQTSLTPNNNGFTSELKPDSAGRGGAPGRALEPKTETTTTPLVVAEHADSVDRRAPQPNSNGDKRATHTTTTTASTITTADDKNSTELLPTIDNNVRVDDKKPKRIGVIWGRRGDSVFVYSRDLAGEAQLNEAQITRLHLKIGNWIEFRRLLFA